MKIRAWKWKILSLVLLCISLGLALNLLLTRTNLLLVQYELGSKDRELAKREAEIDIRDGKLRIYEIEVGEPKTNTYGRPEFSGEKDGPFEIWKETVSTNLEVETLHSKSEYYRYYNRTIYELYRFREEHGSLTVDPATNSGPRFRPGIPVPWLDAQSNSYNCTIELRVSESAEIDPLTRTYHFHNQSASAYGNWLPKAPIRQENGFKVFEVSFSIYVPHERHGLVLEPGFHPAQLFRLSLPEPLKTNGWSDWKSPDCIEMTNTAAAYRRDLDAGCHSTSLPANHYEVRYKIEAIYHGPEAKETHAQRVLRRVWMTFLDAAKMSLVSWTVFVAVWVFVYWMDQPLGWARMQIKRAIVGIRSGGTSQVSKAFDLCGSCPSCGHLFGRNYRFWSLKIFPNVTCPSCNRSLKPNVKWTVFFLSPLGFVVGVLCWMALDCSVGWVVPLLAFAGCFVVSYIFGPYITKYETSTPEDPKEKI